MQTMFFYFNNCKPERIDALLLRYKTALARGEHVHRTGFKGKQHRSNCPRECR